MQQTFAGIKFYLTVPFYWKTGDECLLFPIPMNVYFNENSASGKFTDNGHELHLLLFWYFA